MSATPKIFVFCNSCEPEWHWMIALAEDGTSLASHVCSHHGFAAHDMGIDPNGWQRDKYAAHYPQGFDVVWVPESEVMTHPGLKAAIELQFSKAEGDAA